MMSDICYSDDEQPGPTHSFKFRYSDDICSFLVIAHGLSGAQIFTNRIVRLEEIFPSDVQTPCKYLIGRKMPLEEGGGFLASFDLTQIQIVNPLLGKVSESGEIIDPVADYIFIITVLQSQYDQFGVSYTARDNFLVAAADFLDPVKGLIKRCSISRTPVFDQPGPGEDEALASVWLPSLVPPLIVGLESLLLMGENAVITLPLKCNAAPGYYKAPPPHLLRLRQENAESNKHGSDPTVFGPDNIINLPTSP